MGAPTLSVCMTNYNHGRFIGGALEAILSQSHAPMEILVVDDASTDDSVKVIESFARKNPTIRLTRNERNESVLVNMNRMFAMAKGEYWYGAAADDVVRPGFFEKSLRLLEAHPEAGLCSALSDLIDERGERLGLVLGDPFPGRAESWLTPAEVRVELARRPCWIMGNTTIYRRCAINEAGGFPMELDAFSDGFVSELVARRHGACFIGEPLAAWRRMDGGFADGVKADWRKLAAVRDATLTLMRGRFHDTFTEEDAQRWKTRWEANGLVALARKQRGEWRRAVSELLDGRGEPSSPPARLSCALIEVAYLWIKLVALVRLRGVAAIPVLLRSLAGRRDGPGGAG